MKVLFGPRSWKNYGPTGFCALMAITAGKCGASVLGPLAQFISTIYAALAVHLVVILMGLYYLFTRKVRFLPS